MHVPLPRQSVERIGSRLTAVKKYNPLMFCLNDGPSVPDVRIELAAGFLKEYFPESSGFELRGAEEPSGVRTPVVARGAAMSANQERE